MDKEPSGNVWKSYTGKITQNAAMLFSTVAPNTTSFLGSAKTLKRDLMRQEASLNTIQSNVMRPILSNGAKALDKAMSDIATGQYSFDKISDSLFSNYEDQTSRLFSVGTAGQDTRSSDEIIADSSKGVAQSVIQSSMSNLQGLSSLSDTLIKSNIEIAKSSNNYLGKLISYGIRDNTNIASFTHAKLDNITNILTAQLDFMNTNTLSFYNKSIAMMDSLGKLIETTNTSGKEYKRAGYDSRGGFSIGEYAKFLKDSIGSTFAGGAATAIGGALKTGGREAISGNIFHGLISNLIVSPSLKRSISDFDKNLDSYIKLSLRKLSKMEPLQAFGLDKILGVEIPKLGKIDLGSYNKDSMAWSGKDHKALTEVIPELLTEIASNTSGRDKRYYDYDEGRFKNSKDIRRDYEREYIKAIDMSMYDAFEQLKRVIDNTDLDRRERMDLDKEIKKLVEDQILSNRNMGETTTNMASLAKGANIDKDTFQNLMLTMQKGMEESIHELNALYTKIGSSDSIYRNIASDDASIRSGLRNSKSNISGKGFSYDRIGTSLGARKVLEKNRRAIGFDLDDNEALLSNIDYQLVSGLISEEEAYGILLKESQKRRFISKGTAWLSTTSIGNSRAGRLLQRVVDSTGYEDRYGDKQSSTKRGVNRLSAKYGMVTDDEYQRYEEPSHKPSRQDKLAGRITGYNTRIKESLMGGYGYDDVEGIKPKSSGGATSRRSTISSPTNIKGLEDINNVSAMDPKKVLGQSMNSLTKTFRTITQANDELSDMNPPSNTMDAISQMTQQNQVAMGAVVAQSQAMTSQLFGKEGYFTKILESEKLKELKDKAMDKLFVGEDAIFKNQYESVRAYGKELKSDIGGKLKSGYDKVYDATMQSIYGDNYKENEKYKNNKILSRTLNRSERERLKSENGLPLSEEDVTPISTTIADSAEEIAEVTDKITTQMKAVGEATVGNLDESTESKKKDFISEFKGKLKSTMPKALIAGAGGALVGAMNSSFSLLGSFFLPGGPIAGAMVGVGLSILSQTETFKSLMFGKIDPETNEREGGLISNKMQKWFKASAPKVLGTAAIGGAIGGAASLAGFGSLGVLGMQLLPGGILGGAVLGAGVGLLKNSETFKNLLFGKKDEDGKRAGTFISKGFEKVKQGLGGALPFLKGGLKGLGIGALAGGTLSAMGYFPAMMSMGGPIGMGVVGLGLGIASAGKNFNAFMFGTEMLDENGNVIPGKRNKDGLLSRTTNLINTNIIEPISKTFKKKMVDLVDWSRDKITYPFRLAFGPILDSIGGIRDNVTDFVKGKFESLSNGIMDMFRTVTKTLFSPITKAIGFVGKSVISLGSTALKVGASPLTLGLQGMQWLTAGKRRKEYTDFYKGYYTKGNISGRLNEMWDAQKAAGKGRNVFQRMSDRVGAYLGQGPIADAAREGYNERMAAEGKNRLNWRNVGQERREDLARRRLRDREDEGWDKIDKVRNRIINKDLSGREIDLNDTQLSEYRNEFAKLGIDRNKLQSSKQVMDLLYRRDSFRGSLDGLDQEAIKIAETPEQKEAREKTEKFQNTMEEISSSIRDDFRKIADEILIDKRTDAMNKKNRLSMKRISRQLANRDFRGIVDDTVPFVGEKIDQLNNMSDEEIKASILNKTPITGKIRGYGNKLLGGINSAMDKYTIKGQLNSIGADIRDSKVGKIVGKVGSGASSGISALTSGIGKVGNLLKRSIRLQVPGASGKDLTDENVTDTEIERLTDSSHIGQEEMKNVFKGALDAHDEEDDAEEAKKKADADREAKEKAESEAVRSGAGQETDEEKSFFKRMTGAVSTGMSKFTESKAGKFIMKGLGVVFDIGKVIAGIAAGIIGVGTLIEFFKPGTLEKVGIAINTFTTDVEEGKYSSEYFVGKYNEFVEDMHEGWTDIKANASEVFDRAGVYISETWDETIVPAIKQSYSNLKDSLPDMIVDSANWIGENADRMVSSLTTALSVAAGPLVTAVISATPEILSALGTAGISILKNIGGGLIDWVSEKFGWGSPDDTKADLSLEERQQAIKDGKHVQNEVVGNGYSTFIDAYNTSEAMGYENASIRKNEDGTYRIETSKVTGDRTYIDSESNERIVADSASGGLVDVFGTSTRNALQGVSGNAISGLGKAAHWVSDGALRLSGKGLTSKNIFGTLGGSALGVVGTAGKMVAIPTGIYGSALDKEYEITKDRYGNTINSIEAVDGNSEKIISSINSNMDDVAKEAVDEIADNADKTTDVLDDIAKRATSEAVSESLDAQKKVAQELVDEATKHISDLSKDSAFKKVLQGAGIIGENISKFIQKILDPIAKVMNFPAALLAKAINWILGSIAKATGKNILTVSTAGVSAVLDLAIGATFGAFSAANLFGIPEEYVDGLMVTISMLFGALLEIGIGVWLDLALVLAELAGFNFKRDIANWIYSLFKGEVGNTTLETARTAQLNDSKFYNAINSTNLDVESYNDRVNLEGAFGYIGSLFSDRSDVAEFDQYKNTIDSLIGIDTFYQYDTAQQQKIIDELSSEYGYDQFTIPTETVGYGKRRRGIGYGSQGDSRWSNVRLGRMPDGSPATMANAGCGPTALSTVINKITNKNTVNPGDVGKYAASNGYITDGGANAGLFTQGAARLGLSGKEITDSGSLYNSVASGRPTILSGTSNDGSDPFTSIGHIVVADGMRGNKININDPATGRSKMYDINKVAKKTERAWGYGPSAFEQSLGIGLESALKSIDPNATIPTSYSLSSIGELRDANLSSALDSVSGSNWFETGINKLIDTAAMIDQQYLTGSFTTQQLHSPETYARVEAFNAHILSDSTGVYKNMVYDENKFAKYMDKNPSKLFKDLQGNVIRPLVIFDASGKPKLYSPTPSRSYSDNIFTFIMSLAGYPVIMVSRSTKRAALPTSPSSTTVKELANDLIQVLNSEIYTSGVLSTTEPSTSTEKTMTVDTTPTGSDSTGSGGSFAGTSAWNKLLGKSITSNTSSVWSNILGDVSGYKTQDDDSTGSSVWNTITQPYVSSTNVGSTTSTTPYSMSLDDFANYVDNASIFGKIKAAFAIPTAMLTSAIGGGSYSEALASALGITGSEAEQLVSSGAVSSSGGVTTINPYSIADDGTGQYSAYLQNIINSPSSVQKEVLGHLAKRLYQGETGGNYAKVTHNDNGYMSIGVYQTHSGNAAHLLEQISNNYVGQDSVRKIFDKWIPHHADGKGESVSAEEGAELSNAFKADNYGSGSVKTTMDVTGMSLFNDEYMRLLAPMVDAGLIKDPRSLVMLADIGNTGIYNITSPSKTNSWINLWKQKDLSKINKNNELEAVRDTLQDPRMIYTTLQGGKYKNGYFNRMNATYDYLKSNPFKQSFSGSAVDEFAKPIGFGPDGELVIADELVEDMNNAANNADKVVNGLPENVTQAGLDAFKARVDAETTMGGKMALLTTIPNAMMSSAFGATDDEGNPLTFESELERILLEEDAKIKAQNETNVPPPDNIPGAIQAINTNIGSGANGTPIVNGNDVERVLQLANSQLGYLEKASNYDLQSFTGNPGNGNYAKYIMEIMGGPGEWCAAFTSWLGKAAGISSDIYKHSAAVDIVEDKYAEDNRWFARGSITPQPGDLITFSYNKPRPSPTLSADATHIELVTGTSGNRVQTIGGNTGHYDKTAGKYSTVAVNDFDMNSETIMGYMRPAYSNQSKTVNPADYLKLGYGPDNKNNSKTIEKKVYAQMMKDFSSPFPSSVGYGKSKTPLRNFDKYRKRKGVVGYGTVGVYNSKKLENQMRSIKGSDSKPMTIQRLAEYSITDNEGPIGYGSVVNGVVNNTTNYDSQSTDSRLDQIISIVNDWKNVDGKKKPTTNNSKSVTNNVTVNNQNGNTVNNVNGKINSGITSSNKRNLLNNHTALASRKTSRNITGVPDGNLAIDSYTI